MEMGPCVSRDKSAGDERQCGPFLSARELMCVSAQWGIRGAHLYQTHNFSTNIMQRLEVFKSPVNAMSSTANYIKLITIRYSNHM